MNLEITNNDSEIINNDAFIFNYFDYPYDLTIDTYGIFNDVEISYEDDISSNNFIESFNDALYYKFDIKLHDIDKIEYSLFEFHPEIEQKPQSILQLNYQTSTDLTMDINNKNHFKIRTGRFEFNTYSYLTEQNKNISVLKVYVKLNYKKLLDYVLNNYPSNKTLFEFNVNMCNADSSKEDILKSLDYNSANENITAINKIQSIQLSEDFCVEILLKGVCENSTDGQTIYNIVDNITIYYSMGLKDEAEQLIKNVIDFCYDDSKAEENLDGNPMIGLISMAHNNYYIKDFNIKNKFNKLEKEQFDLHYGDGFFEFNEKLSNIILSDSKGLIILHGEAGTGKTYYIRNLLQAINKLNKNVIYIPSNYIDSLLEPSFITFLTDWIIQNKHKTVLLLEDAESLIESRDSNNRSIGVSNLLNLTDGILNDLLGTQIILTFNTDIQNIDSALLRPERLLARKEFKKLTIEKSNELLQYLNLNINADKPMSLAEIFSLKNDKKTLIHDFQEKNKSSFGFNK